jgi:hypothetical protein
VSAYIEEHREPFGVEPICETLGARALRRAPRSRAWIRPRVGECAATRRRSGSLLILSPPVSIRADRVGTDSWEVTLVSLNVAYSRRKCQP